MNTNLSILQLLVMESKRTASFLSILLVILLTVGGCKGLATDGLILQKAQTSSDLKLSGTVPALYGKIPYQMLVKELVKSNVVRGYSHAPNFHVDLWGPRTIEELRAGLRLNGLDLVGDTLLFSSAFSGLDTPDELGRPLTPRSSEFRMRGLVIFEFFRVAAGVDITQISSSASLMKFQSVFTPGTPLSFSSTSERSYQSNMSVGDTDTFVQSSREIVSAGLEFSGFIGVKDDIVRMDGTLSVSSFSGSSTDRSSVHVPLFFDSFVDQPVVAQRVSASDLNVSMAFSNFDWDALASAEEVVVRVTVQLLSPPIFRRVEGLGEGVSQSEASDLTLSEN